MAIYSFCMFCLFKHSWVLSTYETFGGTAVTNAIDGWMMNYFWILAVVGLLHQMRNVQTPFKVARNENNTKLR